MVLVLVNGFGFGFSLALFCWLTVLAGLTHSRTSRARTSHMSHTSTALPGDVVFGCWFRLFLVVVVLILILLGDLGFMVDDVGFGFGWWWGYWFCLLDCFGGAVFPGIFAAAANGPRALPDLPCPVESLEPFIDAATMKVFLFWGLVFRSLHLILVLVDGFGLVGNCCIYGFGLWLVWVWLVVYFGLYFVMTPPRPPLSLTSPPTQQRA